MEFATRSPIHILAKVERPSVVTSKPAIGGQVKTGQWEAVRD
jgi:hypothetical protein